MFSVQRFFYFNPYCHPSLQFGNYGSVYNIANTLFL